MIDEAREIEEGARVETDLCIVGAGAAGISLALQFLRGPARVLLLEAGGLSDDPRTQSLYEGEVVDPHLHSPPDRYRQRRFGGSTTIWGGRCMPLDPVDLEHRPWMPESDWPIGLDALRPYYPAANALCEAGDFSYEAEAAFPGGMRPLIGGFTSADLTTNTLERFSCPTDFGSRYRERLRSSPHLRVLLHANVTRIDLDPKGERVSGLAVRTLAGRSFTVAAERVVLATGGLEIPRLLLASRAIQPNGIGNAGDWVGRGYMCHVAGTAGTLELKGPPEGVWHGYERAEDGAYCRRRFALSADAQRRLGVGNVVARLHHPRIPDPAHRTGALSALYLARRFIPYEYAKRLASADGRSWRDDLAHAWNVARDPFGTAGFLTHWLRHRTLAERKFPSVVIRPRANRYSLDFHAEQAPNRASRVSLTTSVDALGMPKLLVDWRFSRIDLDTVSALFRVLARDVASSGLGGLRWSEAEVEEASLRDGAYGGHHIGTARMSALPANGVVDADCRVHGVRNLYLAGSAVFPTSGQANPTLTIVALALRLAATLRREHDASASPAIAERADARSTLARLA